MNKKDEATMHHSLSAIAPACATAAVRREVQQ